MSQNYFLQERKVLLDVMQKLLSADGDLQSPQKQLEGGGQFQGTHHSPRPYQFRQQRPPVNTWNQPFSRDPHPTTWNLQRSRPPHQMNTSNQQFTRPPLCQYQGQRQNFDVRQNLGSGLDQPYQGQSRHSRPYCKNYRKWIVCIRLRMLNLYSICSNNKPYQLQHQAKMIVNNLMEKFLLRYKINYG